MPTMNATRQATSWRWGRSKPPTMPLMPAMRPARRANSTAAMPISAPPPSARQGVKETQSMCMSLPAVEAVERFQQRHGARIGDGVVDALAVAAGGDEPLLAQHRELLRQRRLDDAGALR